MITIIYHKLLNRKWHQNSWSLGSDPKKQSHQQMTSNVHTPRSSGFVKLHSDPQYVWPRFQVPAVPASIDNQHLGKVSTPNGDKLIWLHPRSHSFSRETWVELSWVADFTGFVEGLLIREYCHPFHVISLASVLVMLAQPIEIPSGQKTCKVYCCVLNLRSSNQA